MRAETLDGPHLFFLKTPPCFPALGPSTVRTSFCAEALER